MAAEEAPRRGGGVVRDLNSNRLEDQWSLQDYIAVAVELDLLPAARANSIDQVLRGYRNFVHPRRELRMGFDCNSPVAMQSFATLNIVCDHLERNEQPG